MEKILERTCYGDVIEAENGNACVYIDGTEVSKEPRFMFSYNINPFSGEDPLEHVKVPKLIDPNNIDQFHVEDSLERNSYIRKIIRILHTCKSDSVIFPLVNEIGNFNYEELQWVDVCFLAMIHSQELYPDSDSTM